MFLQLTSTVGVLRMQTAKLQLRTISFAFSCLLVCQYKSPSLGKNIKFNMLYKMLFLVQLLLLSNIQTSSATSTLLVCGIHGTNCPNCDEEQRQCMKVRPTKTLNVADVPATTCPQIDPPGLQLDAGPAADDIPDDDGSGSSGGTNDGSGGNDRAMRASHRKLPKKPKEIVVVGSRQTFKVETEVNDITSVWWRHLQEQDDFDCDSKTPPETLRMVRVDMFVLDDDDYDCDDYQRELDGLEERGPARREEGRSISPEIGDEVLVTYLGQRVHVLLQDVLVEGIELNLAAGGTEITQTVTLTMKEMSLYTESIDKDDLQLVWARQYQDFMSHK